MKLAPKALTAAAKKVKLVLTDVDGVLTAGPIYHYVDPGSEEVVEFKGIHTHDSIALAWLAECGFITGVISGRTSKGIEARMKMLKVTHMRLHRLDKAAALAEILGETGLKPEQTLYMGDDLPDLAALARVGLAVAPANARPEVKSAAHWVTKARGGEAAFREAAEFLLKTQGHWPAILARYR